MKFGASTAIEFGQSELGALTTCFLHTALCGLVPVECLPIRGLTSPPPLPALPGCAYRHGRISAPTDLVARLTQSSPAGAVGLRPMFDTCTFDAMIVIDGLHSLMERDRNGFESG